MLNNAGFTLQVLEDASEEDQSNEAEFDDFESALRQETASIKNRKPKVLAIRNDIKGVVFFKAVQKMDVDQVIESVLKLVQERNWKPKYQWCSEEFRA